MKVEQPTKGFKPVTVTLENPAEVALFTSLLGGTYPGLREQHFGLYGENAHFTFLKLQHICQEAGIERAMLKVTLL